MSGARLRHAKQFTERWRILSKAAELKPDDTMAIRLRGFAEIGMGEWDKAAATLLRYCRKIRPIAGL